MADFGINYTQNREVSWLRFNERVLEQGGNKEVPLMERLKFVSIFLSNLDEFFMIRMGTLSSMKSLKIDRVDNKSGMTIKEEIAKVIEVTRPLYEKKDLIYMDLMSELREKGIFEVGFNELNPEEIKEVKTYFKSCVLPILSPQIIDKHHPFPHLHNKQLHYVGFVKMNKKKYFSLIPIPLGLQSLYFFKGNRTRYIRIENILVEFANLIFENGNILERGIVRATRNEDINFNDMDVDIEEYDQCSDDIDLRTEMRSLLHKRKRLAVVRLEYLNELSDELKTYLSTKLKLKNSFIFGSDTPLELKDINLLAKRCSSEFNEELFYPTFRQIQRDDLYVVGRVMDKVLNSDILLSFPYESIKPFLDLMKEASQDTETIAIKITIYRLSKQAKLVEYLCAAAENGIDVTVLIELRARFDESNNIRWSERLEEAGCNVIYGFEDYKVHSKICLISRRNGDEIQHITQIGTGNYNETTSKVYTDLTLITADKNIGLEAVEFFRNMGIGNLTGKYQHLMVGPYLLKSKILELMDEQIQLGKYGRIKLKVNGIADDEIIDKLNQASKAGVEVFLCVRGICCMLPDIKGETDNVIVHSVVGRFLEHSRVYAFGEGTNAKVYISSADLLFRNTNRRIEVAVPIYNAEIKERVMEILNLSLRDSINGRKMKKDGTFQRIIAEGEIVNSQSIMLE